MYLSSKLKTRNPRGVLFDRSAALPGICGRRRQLHVRRLAYSANYRLQLLGCTGFSEIMSEKKAATFGIKGFLMKSVIMSDLAKKIDLLLDKR